MDISNIDDLLASGKTPTQPATPEHQYQETPEPVEEMEADTPDYGLDELKESNEEIDSSPKEDEAGDEKPLYEDDEYGNPKEILSKSMQKRLERQAESLKRKYEAEVNALRTQLAQLTPMQQQQVQQAARDFEHDPDSDRSWQEQLDAYIEKTVQNMQTKRQREEEVALEREIQAQFETKLLTGMERFSDFKETIAQLPCEITNPMTIATRSLDDPAAFLYAAAKRHPEELQRISQLRDPYAQIREMGKLEERMRRNKPTTKAPRPLGRTPEDASIPVPKNKQEESIEDLIAKSDSRRLAQLKQRQRIR